MRSTMPRTHCLHNRRTESGGITILVSLLLLVLLTISALAMSKNSLREAVISGTSRQAADVRNLADTGLEWSMYWMADDLTNTRPPAADAAEALRALKASIALDSTLQGIPQPLEATGEMVVYSSPVVEHSFDLSLTSMGEIELQGTQKNVQQVLGVYDPATLQLWSVRSDAKIHYTGDIGGQTFLHRRESWFTLLPAAQTNP